MAFFAVEEAIKHYQRARALLQEDQPMQSVLPTPQIVHLYASLGQSYAFLNACSQAQDVYEELLAYAQQHQLAALASMTLNRLAILAIQQSTDKPTVRALLEEAWHRAQESHDQQALAETAWNLAQITTILWEDLAGALRHGQQALSLARARHDQELEGRCLFTPGGIHPFRGDGGETMHCAQAAPA